MTIGEKIVLFMKTAKDKS